MKTEMKKSLMKMLVVVGLALTIMVALPGTSHASAYGIQYWGGFSVNIGGQTIGIPSGQLAHEINGSGLHINWDGANFASVGNICDSSMRFTYGYGAYYLDGGMHWGCSHVGQWKYTLNWNSPRGSACAELWAHDWRILVARQCHFVS